MPGTPRRNPHQGAWHQLIAAVLLVAGGVHLGSDADAAERKRGSATDPAALYHNYCSVCHGDRGDGNSRAKGSLVPPPRDFTRATDLNREAMIIIVREGKAGTAMAGWGTQLNDREIAAVVDYVRNTFMKVATDPKLQRGRTLYAQNCMACHGDRGQGAPAPSGLIPAKDFTTPQARAELTRERMIASVTNGRPNTQMVAFKGRLPDADIAAVVDYVMAGLMLPTAGSISGTSAHANRSGDDPMALPFINGLTGNVAKGERFYKDNCATCHGIKGDGKGPRAYFINPKPRNFEDAGFRNGFNRPAIYRAVAEGRLGAEMPAWNKVLTDQEIADVSEYVFRAFVQQKTARSSR
ncbi:MAG: c-type cytochrome [Betaproteobacteria bacterium]|nr:c-type cytochrome [Betaproteobacteria bacterium]